MASDFDDVGNFHDKFGLPHANLGKFLEQGVPELAKNLNNEELMKFRIVLIEEELQELKDAISAGDLAEVADALIDLEYVTLGFHHTLGLPHDLLWEDVQRANMAKVRASADGSDSKRGSGFDVVKPKGWRGPDGWSILKHGGFHV